MNRATARMRKGLLMIKPSKVVERGTGKLDHDDSAAWEGFPGWRSFFLDQTYGLDFDARAPGLLIVKATGSGWFWSLKEPTLCLMLKFNSRTWDEGVLMGEAFLLQEDAPWESDPYEAAKRGKARKK